MTEPFLSIVTVCFNAGSLLQGTIDSVARQTSSNFEYIVIDGASKDDTLNIIEENSHHITKWITEPDHGIYDAMNKGLKMATGKYIWFLNAGDEIANDNIVASLEEASVKNHDVIYGEVMIVDSDRKHLGTRSEITVHKLPEHLSLKDMRFGMVVCHQGLIPKLGVTGPFMSNNLSADIDWTIEILKRSESVYNMKITVAEYLAGGISKKKWQTSLKDRFEILQKHFGYANTVFNHIYILFRAMKHKIFRLGKAHY